MIYQKKIFLIFLKKKKCILIHLAAQAGVRNSIYKPYNYLNDNIISQINLYESLKNIKINKFIYASSSSVYGSTSKKNFLKVMN